MYKDIQMKTRTGIRKADIFSLTCCRSLVPYRIQRYKDKLKVE